LRQPFPKLTSLDAENVQTELGQSQEVRVAPLALQGDLAILTVSSAVKTHVLFARLESGVTKGQRFAANAPAGGTAQANPRRTNVKGPAMRAITVVVDRLMQRVKGYALLASGVGRELTCALIVIPDIMAKTTQKEGIVRRALVSVYQDISQQEVQEHVKFAPVENTQTLRHQLPASRVPCNLNPQFLM
jgi:hypothetical protein